MPSSTTETISEVINENEVKRTTTYQKSRTKARHITFDQFRKTDKELSLLNKFNKLEEPLVDQTPCGHEIIDAITEAIE